MAYQPANSSPDADGMPDRRTLIEIALRTMPADRGRTRMQFEQAVALQALEVQQLFRASSLPMRLLDSKIITGTFESADYSESSHRWTVRFIPDKPLPGHEGEPETIASDRMDSSHRMHDDAFFRSLQPGDRILVYKHNDPGDSRAPNGYRTAPLVRRLRPRA